MSLPTSSHDSQNDTAHDPIAAPGGYMPDLNMNPAEARALLTATRRNGLTRFMPSSSAPWNSSAITGWQSSIPFWASWWASRW